MSKFQNPGCRHDILEKMLQYMSAEELLDELIHAMSDDEVKENFEYIARNWNIPIFDEVYTCDVCGSEYETEEEAGSCCEEEEEEEGSGSNG